MSLRPSSKKLKKSLLLPFQKEVIRKSKNKLMLLTHSKWKGLSFRIRSNKTLQLLSLRKRPRLLLLSR